MAKPGTGDVPRADMHSPAELLPWSRSDPRWSAVVDDFRTELAEAVFGSLGPVIEADRIAVTPGWCGVESATMVAYETLEDWLPDELAALPGELIRTGVRQISCVITRDGAFGRYRDLAFYEQLFARAGFRLMREMTPVLAKIPSPVHWEAASGQAIWGLSHLVWNDVPGQLFFVRD